MNDELINLPRETEDFSSVIAANEVQGRVGTAQNGKAYIEGGAGSYSVGQAVVSFTAVFAPAARRRGEFLGWKKEVVGKIADSGKAFEGSMLNNAAYLAGKEPARFDMRQRYYIEAV